MERELNLNIHKIKKDKKTYFYNFDNDLTNKAKSVEELNEQISLGYANISIIEVGIIDSPNKMFDIDVLERFTHFDIDFNTNTVSLNNPEDYLGKYIIIYRKVHNSQPNINLFGNEGNVDFSVKALNENNLGILYNLQDVESNAKLKYINEYNYVIGFNFSDYINLENDTESLENFTQTVSVKVDNIETNAHNAQISKESIDYYNNIINLTNDEQTELLDEFNSNQSDIQQANINADQAIQDGIDLNESIELMGAKDKWRLSELIKLPSSVALQYKERLIKPDGMERDFRDKQLMYLKDVYPINESWDFTVNDNNTLKLYPYSNISSSTHQNIASNFLGSRGNNNNLYRLMGNRLFIYSPHYSLRSQDVNDLSDYWLYVYDTNLETLINKSVDGTDIDFSQFQMVLSKRISLLSNLISTRSASKNVTYSCHITRDGNYILKSSNINENNIYSTNTTSYMNGFGILSIDLNESSFSPNWQEFTFDVMPEDQSLNLTNPLQHVVRITDDDIPSYFYDVEPGDLNNSYIQYINDNITATSLIRISDCLSIFNNEEALLFISITYRSPDFLPPNEEGKVVNKNFSSNSVVDYTALCLKVNLKTKKIQSRPLLVLNGLNPITRDYGFLDTNYKIYRKQVGEVTALRGLEFRGDRFFANSSSINNQYASSPFSNHTLLNMKDYNINNNDKYICNNNIKTDDIVGDNFKVFFTTQVLNGSTYEEIGSFHCYSINKNTGEIKKVTSKTRNDFLTEFNIPVGTSIGQVDDSFICTPSRSLCSDEFTIIQVKLSIFLFLWEEDGVVKHRWVRFQNDLFSGSTTLNYQFGRYNMDVFSNQTRITYRTGSPSFTNTPQFLRHIKGNKFLCAWGYDIIDSLTNTKVYDGIGLQFEITKDIKNGTGILDLTLSEDVFNSNLKPTALTQDERILSSYNSGHLGNYLSNFLFCARTTPSGDPVLFAKGFDYLDEVDPNDDSYIVRFLLPNFKIYKTITMPFIPDDLNNEYENYIVKAPDKINIEGTDLDGEFIE